MGRDWTRVLISAVGSIALIVAATLTMDWYRLSLGTAGNLGTIALDLRSIHVCGPDRLCATAPLSPMPGMFPTLALATLWSSLGLAALIAFQAGSRLLAGVANDVFAKLGYLYALMTIAIAIVTAYVASPATEGAGLDAAAALGLTLHRTWAPAILLVGLIGGFATLYMAVAPASSDMADTYKPVQLPAARVVGHDEPSAPAGAAGRAAADVPPHSRSRTPTVPIPLRSRPPTGAPAAPRSMPRALTGSYPRPPTGSYPRPPTGPGVRADRPTSGTGSHAALRGVGSGTGVHAAIRNPTGPTGSSPALTGASPSVTGGAPSLGRTRTSTLTAIPAHLRNRLSYVALTAELTAGGIDARREDGSARLVLWRDVVGVVARRLPEVYGGTLFVDIVSSAGSTLRIVPWTRLTGEPIAAEGDARQRAVVARAIAMCPTAQVDPATRQFLDAGDAAQLASLDALAAHDAHLA